MKTNNIEVNKDEVTSKEEQTAIKGKDHGFLYFMLGLIGLVIALVLATKLISWLIK